MSDLEHLLENGINAVTNAERNNAEPHGVYINPYEAFIVTMDYPYNKEALTRVDMSIDTLWEIVQYVYYNIINQED